MAALAFVVVVVDVVVVLLDVLLPAVVDIDAVRAFVTDVDDDVVVVGDGRAPGLKLVILPVSDADWKDTEGEKADNDAEKAEDAESTTMGSRDSLYINPMEPSDAS